MLQLRDYQEAVLTETRQAYAERLRAVLLCMPTGAGKTVTASTVVHGAAAKGNVTWWLTHRRELASQASQTFHNLGIPHGTISAGHVSNPQAMVQVASIQTISRRLNDLPEPALIIFDETHHIGAASWSAIFERFPRARVLGLTATPWRLDGVGLGLELGGDGLHDLDGVLVGVEELGAVGAHVGVDMDDAPSEDPGDGDANPEAGQGPDDEALPGVGDLDGIGGIAVGEGVEFFLGHGEGERVAGVRVEGW